MTNILPVKPEIGQVLVLDPANLINVLGETRAYALLDDLAAEGYEFAVHSVEALCEMTRDDWKANFTNWMQDQQAAGRLDDFSDRVVLEDVDTSDVRDSPSGDGERDDFWVFGSAHVMDAEPVDRAFFAGMPLAA